MRGALNKEQELVGELQRALANVKRLEGLLPICAWCKKVRDSKGYWSQVERYVAEHSDAEFTHGICPECREKVKKESLESGSSKGPQ